MQTDGKREKPRSKTEWILEGVSAAALAFAAADVATHWNRLPERIPIHFGVAGNPNGWGGKSMLLLLLGSTVGVAALLTAAEKYQRLVNIPIRVDRESPEVRRLLRGMAIAMKATITVSFAWIVDATVRTSLGQADGLGRAFLPVFLGAILGSIVFYLVRLKKL